MMKKRKLSLTVIVLVLLMLAFTSTCFADTVVKETAKTEWSFVKAGSTGQMWLS